MRASCLRHENVSDTWAYGQPDYVIEIPSGVQDSSRGRVAGASVLLKLPFEEDDCIRESGDATQQCGGRPSPTCTSSRWKSQKAPAMLNGRFMGPDQGRKLPRSSFVATLPVLEHRARAAYPYVPGRGSSRIGQMGKSLPAGQWLVWSSCITPPPVNRNEIGYRIGLYFSKEPVRHVGHHIANLRHAHRRGQGAGRRDERRSS